MRIAKRIALITTAALAAMAITATMASADLAEGPFEGTMEPYSDYIGLPLTCDTQSFSGEITDGASEPATGTIEEWDISDCYAYQPVGCEQDTAMDIEVYDDGTVRLLDFERNCQVPTPVTFSSPAVEGQLCDGFLSFQEILNASFGAQIGWEASWNVTGLEVEDPGEGC